jgi:hypothetical protein
MKTSRRDANTGHSFHESAVVFVPSEPPCGHHSVEGVASSRDVKGSVEPPHSMTKSGAENDYDFFDLL